MTGSRMKSLFAVVPRAAKMRDSIVPVRYVPVGRRIGIRTYVVYRRYSRATFKTFKTASFSG